MVQALSAPGGSLQVWETCRENVGADIIQNPGCVPGSTLAQGRELAPVGSNSQPHTCKAGAYAAELNPQPLVLFLKIISIHLSIHPSPTICTLMQHLSIHSSIIHHLFFCYFPSLLPPFLASYYSSISHPSIACFIYPKTVS